MFSRLKIIPHARVADQRALHSGHNYRNIKRVTPRFLPTPSYLYRPGCRTIVLIKPPSPTFFLRIPAARTPTTLCIARPIPKDSFHSSPRDFMFLLSPVYRADPTYTTLRTGEDVNWQPYGPIRIVDSVGGGFYLGGIGPWKSVASGHVSRTSSSASASSAHGSESRELLLYFESHIFSTEMPL